MAGLGIRMDNLGDRRQEEWDKYRNNEGKTQETSFIEDNRNPNEFNDYETSSTSVTVDSNNLFNTEQGMDDLEGTVNMYNRELDRIESRLAFTRERIRRLPNIKGEEYERLIQDQYDLEGDRKRMLKGW